LNRTVALTGAGTIQSDAGTLTVSGAITNGANTLTVTGAGNTTISGVIGNGSGGVTKNGTGTLNMTAANTYTGDTTVNNGTVIVSGSLSGNVHVASTGTIAGTLASGNNTTSAIAALTVDSNNATTGGTVAPGGTTTSGTNGVGVLNVAGDVTLGTLAGTGAAHLSIELGGTTAGVGQNYDQIIASGGTVSLNNVNLDGSLINSYAPVSATLSGGTLGLNGDTYFIVAGAGTLTGTFANQGAPDSNLPGYNTIIFGGQEFAISYSASFSGGNFAAGSGNDVALMAIPEPNSLAMLAGSFGLTIGLQRLRRRRGAPSIKVS
jgi:autotransporter-associated beta strand protein